MIGFVIESDFLKYMSLDFCYSLLFCSFFKPKNIAKYIKHGLNITNIILINYILNIREQCRKLISSYNNPYCLTAGTIIIQLFLIISVLVLAKMFCITIKRILFYFFLKAIFFFLFYIFFISHLLYIFLKIMFNYFLFYYSLGLLSRNYFYFSILICIQSFFFLSERIEDKILIPLNKE